MHPYNYMYLLEFFNICIWTIVFYIYSFCFCFYQAADWTILNIFNWCCVKVILPTYCARNRYLIWCTFLILDNIKLCISMQDIIYSFPYWQDPLEILTKLYSMWVFCFEDKKLSCSTKFYICNLYFSHMS